MKLPPIVYHSMYGLGDNIMIRPFIRAQSQLREVYLSTCWPQLFEDLNVTLLAPRPTSLRTQKKNMESEHRTYAPMPMKVRTHKIAYGHAQLALHRSIPRAFESQMPLHGQKLVWDLPARMLAGPKQKVALIRPVTVRKEWHNSARNPRPEYIARIAEALMATHTVILVADLAPGEEEMIGPVPPHHNAFLRGELGVFTLLNMAARSDILVGGVGWIVPAAISTGVHAFIVCGGQFAHNSPSVITDPRMDLSRIRFAIPDNPCQCSNMRHECNKTNSNLATQWNTAASLGTTLCSTLSPLAA